MLKTSLEYRVKNREWVDIEEIVNNIANVHPEKVLPSPLINGEVSPNFLKSSLLLNRDRNRGLDYIKDQYRNSIINGDLFVYDAKTKKAKLI